MSRAKLILLTAAAAALAGCVNEAKSQASWGGPTVDRTFAVGQFSRLEVAGPYEVQVHTGSAPTVRASGSERALERMEVVVDGDTLRIRPRKQRGVRSSDERVEPARVAVTVPALRGAEIAGSGGIEVDRIAGDSFEGAVAGSGDLRLGSIEVGRLKMTIAGSGDIRAEGGRAASAHYSIAGSGDIDMGDLSVDAAAVSIAGSGNISGTATRTATVSIAGSGDVRLRGGAACEVSRIGSGRVDCS